MPQEVTPRHYSTKLSDISACDKSHNLRRITSPTKRLRNAVFVVVKNRIPSYFT